MPQQITTPNLLLRFEGAALAILAMVLYRELGASWWLFVLLFLVPDLSMLGYLAGTRVGAAVYNAIHTYAIPLLLFAFGFLVERTLLMTLALIWTAHIGVDRVVGFGLKYPTAFKDTHLQRT